MAKPPHWCSMCQWCFVCFVSSFQGQSDRRRRYQADGSVRAAAWLAEDPSGIFTGLYSWFRTSSSSNESKRRRSRWDRILRQVFFLRHFLENDGLTGTLVYWCADTLCQYTDLFNKQTEI